MNAISLRKNRLVFGGGLLAIVVCLGGCSKHGDEGPKKTSVATANETVRASTETEKKADADSRRVDALIASVKDQLAHPGDENRVYRMEWDFDIDDGDISMWPANLYAKANSASRKMLGQMFPADGYRDIEVHIVPRFQGYGIVALSRRILKKEDWDQIHWATVAAIDEAHENWVKKFDDKSSSRKELNQSSTAQRP